MLSLKPLTRLHRGLPVSDALDPQALLDSEVIGWYKPTAADPTPHLHNFGSGAAEHVHAWHAACVPLIAAAALIKARSERDQAREDRRATLSAGKFWMETARTAVAERDAARNELAKWKSMHASVTEREQAYLRMWERAALSPKEPPTDEPT